MNMKCGFVLKRIMSTAAREDKIKRLLYQSKYRGTSEIGTLLGTFATKHLHNLPHNQLDEYDRILQESDIDLFLWVTAAQKAPERLKNSKIFDEITKHSKNLKNMDPLNN